MEQFDFDKLQTALNNVNHAAGIISSGAALLGSSQQSALLKINELAQAFYALQREIAEKDAKIAELEEALKAKEPENGGDQRYNNARTL